MTRKYVQAKLFKIFLVGFFLYFETKFLPGSIHSYIMIIGLLPLFPNVYSSLLRGEKRFNSHQFYSLFYQLWCLC